MPKNNASEIPSKEELRKENQKDNARIWGWSLLIPLSLVVIFIDAAQFSDFTYSGAIFLAIAFLIYGYSK